MSERTDLESGTMAEGTGLVAAGMTRRSALAAGSLASFLLSSSVARAASGLARFARPRPLANVDHLVVYRRENEFVGWPHTMGYWNLGGGELLQQVTSINTSYGNADSISHDNIGREG
jgi:hypothetical protein